MSTVIGSGYGKLRMPAIRKVQAIAATVGARFVYIDITAPTRWFFESDAAYPDMIASKLREKLVASTIAARDELVASLSE